MAKIGKTPVSVGDVVRTDDTDDEGQVLEIEGAKLLLRMHVSDPHTGSNDREVLVADVHWNPWDERFEESGKTGPFEYQSLAPSMTGTEGPPATGNPLAYLFQEQSPGDAPA